MKCFPVNRKAKCLLLCRPASPRDTERGRSPLVVRGRRGTDDAVKVLAAKRAAAAAAAAEELAAARPTSRRAASEEQRPQPPRRATAADDAPQPKPLRRSATDDYPVKPTQANPKAASRRTTADEVRAPICPFLVLCAPKNARRLHSNMSYPEHDLAQCTLTDTINLLLLSRYY
jgi:hypothetical protein